jgi:Protein of unknown function (DUF3108)
MAEDMVRRFALVLALAGWAAAPARGQGATVQSGPPVHLTPAELPFQPGEEMSYEVTLSPFGRVGDGSLSVVALDTLRGIPTFRLRLDVKGGLLFAHIDDHLQSWVDPADFRSLRYQQDQHEVNYRKKQTLDFYPSEMEWVSSNGKSGQLGSDQPLDDVSFLYYARLLPLEVGQTYVLNRYFSPAGNPVTLKVLRKDTVTVPAGTFPTIVVQPIIRTKGLFSQGGKAEVYFTDDARRILVLIKSNVPIVGSLDLRLRGYVPGEWPGAPPPSGGSAPKR